MCQPRDSQGGPAPLLSPSSVVDPPPLARLSPRTAKVVIVRAQDKLKDQQAKEPRSRALKRRSVETPTRPSPRWVTRESEAKMVGQFPFSRSQAAYEECCQSGKTR